MSWFDENGILTDPTDGSLSDRQLLFTEATPTGQISAQQAETINRLMREGVPLNEIAAATALPASLIQSLTGYATNGPNNQGGAEVEQAAPTTQTASGASDPLAFIAEWQRTHPATRDSFLQLANELQTRFGVQRAPGAVGPSNNEFTINGEKVKVMSAEDSGNPSWFAYGADDGWRPDGGTSSLFSGTSYTAPAPFSFPGYQQPAPFSYDSFTPPAPFQAPTAQQALDNPGFKFRLEQGQDALERSASSRGTLLTGGTLEELLSLSQDMASQEYDKVYNRDLNAYAMNFGNLADVYNLNRNNAASNYQTNLSAGQTGYGLNQSNALQSYQTNLAAGQGAFDRNRLSGLDAYQSQQDQIRNLFNLADFGQSATGVPNAYVPRY